MSSKVEGGAPIRGSAEPVQGPTKKSGDSVKSDPANTTDVKSTNPFQVRGTFELPNGLKVTTK